MSFHGGTYSPYGCVPQDIPSSAHIPAPPAMTPSSGAPFRFRLRHERVDWRRINAVDVDLVVSQLDLDVLQEHLSSVTFCSLEGERCPRCQSPVDPVLVKVLRLAQLSVEWLLHCQDFLSINLRTAEERLSAAGREHQRLLGQLTKQKEKEKALIAELMHREKVIQTQQSVLTTQNIDIQKCPHCEKYFLNNSFLQKHLQRRHPEEYHIQLQADKENKCEIDDLKSEINRLKEQMVQQQQQALETKRIQEENWESRLEEMKALHQSEKNQLQEELSRIQLSLLEHQEHAQNLQQKTVDCGRWLQNKERTIHAQRDQMKSISSNRPPTVEDVPDSSSLSEKRPAERKSAPTPERKSTGQSRLKNDEFHAIPAKLQTQQDIVTSRISDLLRQRKEILSMMEQRLSGRFKNAAESAQTHGSSHADTDQRRAGKAQMSPPGPTTPHSGIEKLHKPREPTAQLARLLASQQFHRSPTPTAHPLTEDPGYPPAREPGQEGGAPTRGEPSARAVNGNPAPVTQPGGSRPRSQEGPRQTRPWGQPAQGRQQCPTKPGTLRGTPEDIPTTPPEPQPDPPGKPPTTTARPQPRPLPPLPPLTCTERARESTPRTACSSKPTPVLPGPVSSGSEPPGPDARRGGPPLAGSLRTSRIALPRMTPGQQPRTHHTPGRTSTEENPVPESVRPATAPTGGLSSIKIFLHKVEKKYKVIKAKMKDSTRN